MYAASTGKLGGVYRDGEKGADIRRLMKRETNKQRQDQETEREKGRQTDGSGREINQMIYAVTAPVSFKLTE
jgi:hypothetical protein